MSLIRREAQTDATKEALEVVEAHLNNVGLPSYNALLLAMEQIERLAREGTREGQVIRDAVQEIAGKALGK